MLKPTGQSLATKGMLEQALGIATAGVIGFEQSLEYDDAPRVLMTKGVSFLPQTVVASSLMTKGVLTPVLVIIEEPEEPTRPPSVGGGGISPPVWKPQKKIKVTVLLSGETRTQEVVVTPGIDVDAQILEMFELPENTVFVRVKRKP